ncbi:MAG: hypothetical protein V1837_04435 [Candidatus Woesearchaeota archaeon]
MGKTNEIKEANETHEFVFDQINGGKGKKPVLSMLNKGKISKFEMDQLFCEE